MAPGIDASWSPRHCCFCTNLNTSFWDAGTPPPPTEHLPSLAWLSHPCEQAHIGGFFLHPSPPGPYPSLIDLKENAILVTCLTSSLLKLRDKSQLELSQRSREGTSKREVPLQPRAGPAELVGLSRIYLINIPLPSNRPEWFFLICLSEKPNIIELGRWLSQ